MQKYKQTQIQEYKNISKNQKIQKHKNTTKYKNAKVQKYKTPKQNFKKYKNSKIQKYENINIQKKRKNITIKNAKITQNDFEIKQIIVCQKKDMKEPWILACSREDFNASQILYLYSKRWGIETSFRDIKDYKFGMGMKHMHTKSVNRRDKLFLISAFAIALLTLLGRAGDAAGLERKLKANTSKTRTYSFWRQGCLYFNLIGSFNDSEYQDLMDNFYKLIKKSSCI